MDNKELSAEERLKTFRREISQMVVNDFSIVNEAWKVNLIEMKCKEYAILFHKEQLRKLRDEFQEGINIHCKDTTRPEYISYKVGLETGVRIIDNRIKE